MNMEKDVIITIDSLHKLGLEEPESTKVVSLGKYSYTPEEQRISYMESEATGMAGTKTEFTIRENHVTLKRSGSVTSVMQFKRDHRHKFSYETPYGTMLMSMETMVLETALGEQGGKMRLEYVLCVEKVPVSGHKININIKIKG